MAFATRSFFSFEKEMASALPFRGRGAPPYRTEVQKSRDEGMKMKSLVEKIRLGLIGKRMNGYNI
jgi:hypothetical protein